MLYSATLTNKVNEQEARYKKTTEVYPNDCRAYNNLATIALQAGDAATAENYIGKASDANGLAEVLGNLHLAQGNYALAEQDFKKVNSNSAALAQILNKNYSAAEKTLNNVKNADAMTDYLKAVLNARQGNKGAAKNALAAALAKDPSLASYAAKDLELSDLSK